MTDPKDEIIERVQAENQKLWEWFSSASQQAALLENKIAVQDKEISDLKDYIKDLEFSIRTGMEKYP